MLCLPPAHTACKEKVGQAAPVRALCEETSQRLHDIYERAEATICGPNDRQWECSGQRHSRTKVEVSVQRLAGKIFSAGRRRETQPHSMPPGLDPRRQLRSKEKAGSVPCFQDRCPLNWPKHQLWERSANRPRGCVWPQFSSHQHICDRAIQPADHPVTES